MGAVLENTKKAVLILNVGTPDKPEVKSVRKYLSEFLNDPFVIDLPWLLRKILVNLIIIPFRAPKSTKLYQQLWEKEGSPLLTNAIKLKEKLAKKFGNEYSFFMAMRYGNPSIDSALKEISKGNFGKLIVVPLFPHYAASTTETAIQAVMNQKKKYPQLPEIQFVNQFYDQPGFLKAWSAKAAKYLVNDFDHIVFSYHGLPLSHIQKSHHERSISSCTCDIEMPAHGEKCYRATVYETTRLLAKEFGLIKNQYSVSFQSRFSKNWLSPFTDSLLRELATQGKRKVLLFAPSFVADCLETKVELGIEYAKLFQEAGGGKLELVESLNDSDPWVEALDSIIREAKI
jgi:ferrochelatase